MRKKEVPNRSWDYEEGFKGERNHETVQKI